jgi:ABC-2 type transport system permease protein
MFSLIQNPIGVLSLSKREILRFLSVASQTIFPAMISASLFMYIFGVAIGRNLSFDSGGLSYLGFIVPGLMTMHLISSSYENTSSSLFIARWHNHIQEVLLSPLSYFEMVVGLLAGGVARGMIVSIGVFLVSLFFHQTAIAHPFILVYFMVTISTIFACAGMMGALWAEDFNMLSMWNIYVIVPLVFLGGVFHPITVLPESIQIFTRFNPMYYLVSGVRYSMTGQTNIAIEYCAFASFGLMTVFFLLTTYLFRIGYKLRT